MVRYTPTAKYENARRAVRAKNTIRECILGGDEAGALYDTESGYYLARWPSSADETNAATYSPPFRVKANPGAAILPRAGRRVKIKKDEDGEWEVYKISFNDLKEANIDARALEPNTPYRAFRYLNEIVDSNSYPVSGMKVNVREWLYVLPDGTLGLWRGTTASTHIDLTSSIPATTDHHRYAMLFFNTTLHQAGSFPIQVTVSTSQSSITSPLDSTDLQECLTARASAACVPIKAYYLKQGMTVVGNAARDVDMRQFLNVPDDPASTLDIRNQTAGEAWAARDNLYFDSATASWFKIDNDAVPIKVAPLRGVATAAATSGSTTNTIRTRGLMTGYTGLTAGGALFASGTAGGVTQTRPTVSAGGAQVVICDMGRALSTTSAWIDPQTLTYLKRDSLANNGTLTITHHSDAQGRGREATAYLSSTITLLTENNPSSNENTEVALERNGTVTITPDNTGASASGAIGNVSGTYRRAGQSFLATASGTLTQFTVNFAANVGSPSGTVTWAISADASGIPSTTDLATGTFTPPPSDKATITVGSPPTLVEGQTYWLKIRSTNTQTSGNYWQLSINAANPYADGIYAIDTGTGPTTYNNTWSLIGTGNDLRSAFTITPTIYDRLAQGITSATSTNVFTAKLWMKKVGSPTGTLTFAIYSDASGVPGSIITNGTATTISASSLSTSYGWITFSFPVQPALTAATLFHGVLSTTDSASGTNYVIWGAVTPSTYGGGQLQGEVSTAWSAVAAGSDGCFELYALDAIYDEPAVIGRFTGGTRDIGVRYDDGAGADTNTKTTFKNVSGGTLDVTCGVQFEG